MISMAKNCVNGGKGFGTQVEDCHSTGFRGLGILRFFLNREYIIIVTSSSKKI